MSIKAKIAAGAATLALTGAGLGMAGTLTASAATPPCGAGCYQFFSQKFGPRYVGDVSGGQAAAGQPVVLFQSSNSDPAEDFTFRVLGTVDSFYTDHGLVSPAFDQAYGSDAVIELQYEPYGLNSNFCAATWTGSGALQPGAPVSLQPCGQTPGSLWALDTANKVADSHSYFGYDFPLINGGDGNFSNPEVLTYPAGHPTDMPRPQLVVEPEKTYAQGVTFDSQEWGLQAGPVAHGS